LSASGVSRESVRIGFHLAHDLYRPMLEPVYQILKEEFPCLMTKELNSILAFRPQILLVADGQYGLYRPPLPNTIIVWVRHGFASKNWLSKCIMGSDFSCVSSEWLRDEYIGRGWNPRLGYWVTGFPPMDGVLNPDATRKSIKVPDGFSGGKATLLYAPTWNKLMTSIEILGEEWIARIRQSVPDINIIIKPHSHIPKVFPRIMSKWKEAASQSERTLLLDCNEDIYEYFRLADILLSDASSVIFYFLALDRPIILVNNPQRFNDRVSFDPEGPEWAWRDVGIQINHVSELKGAVVSSLENPKEKSEIRAYYRDRVFGDLLDGHAAERIADKVRALVTPKPEDVWVTTSWNSVALRKPVNKATAMVSNVLSLPWSVGSHLSFRLESRPRLKHFLIRIYSPLSRRINLLRSTDKDEIDMANPR